MADVLVLVTELGLTLVLTWWILRRDTARLAGEALARSWPGASFWIAIVCFAPLCIPVHFVKTRRSLLGFVQGLAWMLAVMFVVWAASSLVQALLGAVGGGEGG